MSNPYRYVFQAKGDKNKYVALSRKELTKIEQHNILNDYLRKAGYVPSSILGHEVVIFDDTGGSSAE